MQAKDCQIGDEILIRAVVIGHKPGQVQCWAPGIQQRGRWSMVNSVEVQVEADMTDLQRTAVDALAKPYDAE